MRNKFDKILTKDFLKQEYIDSKRSQGDIAQIVGCSYVTVGRYLKIHNINCRYGREAQTKLMEKPYFDFKWLYQKYVVERKNTTDIARACNVGRTTIKRWLKKHDIKARTNSEAHVGLLRSEKSKKKQAGSVTGKNNPFFGRKHSKKSKKKIGKSKLGSKPHWYRCEYIDRFGKQYKFHSSWELKFAEYLDRNNVDWSSGDKRFYYADDEDIKRCYWPDFYLKDSDSYIEIKGYFRDKDKRKMEIIKETYPKINLEILRRNDLEKIGVL